MAAIGEIVVVAKVNGSGEPIQYSSLPSSTVSGITLYSALVNGYGDFIGDENYRPIVVPYEAP